MNARLSMLAQLTLPGMDSAISLQELADGATRSDSPDGPTTGQSGQDRAHASPSASPVSAKEQPTSATCGLTSPASLRSAALQSSLVNRLRARMDVNGSPEYALTWKEWDMPSGPPICALRASGRRTSDNGFTGWPTPIVNDVLGSTHCYSGKNPDGTPKRYLKLPGAAQLAGWATPTSRDHKDAASDLTNTPINGLLGRQVTLSTAQTENRGALNPAHSRWLQGYPRAWDECAIWAHRSMTLKRES